MTDITKMSGHFAAPIILEDHAIITGTVPVSTAMNYPTTLASFTSGKGHISFVYAGYDICHNTEDVIARLNYNKDADKEYTSTSIFCSHGKSYFIKGSDIDTISTDSNSLCCNKYGYCSTSCFRSSYLVNRLL